MRDLVKLKREMKSSFLVVFVAFAILCSAAEGKLPNTSEAFSFVTFALKQFLFPIRYSEPKERDK